MCMQDGDGKYRNWPERETDTNRPGSRSDRNCLGSARTGTVLEELQSIIMRRLWKFIFFLKYKNCSAQTEHI